jgi:hypothetical protein
LVIETRRKASHVDRKGVDCEASCTFIEGGKMPDTSSGGARWNPSGTLGQRLKLVGA